MERRIARHTARALVLTGVIGLVGATAPAGARLTPGPRVEIQSVAGLAPDARSIGVQFLASCPERWTVVEASVTIAQPQATGTTSFPLTCIGSFRSVWVSVQSSGGPFELELLGSGLALTHCASAGRSDAARVPRG